MSSAVDFVMTEHAAWLPAEGGVRRVFRLPAGGRWLATVRTNVLELARLTGEAAGPVPDVFTLSRDALDTVPDLATALRGLGCVARLRNADLWDAVGTAIIRQVIRAGQSKKLYREFCAAYGERVELPNGGVYALFPTPEIVLGLSDEQFRCVGMAFKRRPLVAAAGAYVERGAQWAQLPPHALIDALQSVPRIGPWTARAAVADWSNDWSLYPYSDLAVRTWAMRAAPSFDWPSDEPSFGRVWRALAGDDLSSLTLLTLAWGSHYGDIG